MRAMSHTSCRSLIGEFCQQALGQFLRSNRSVSKPFKPVSDGFVIDISRKVLPAGDKE